MNEAGLKMVVEVSERTNLNGLVIRVFIFCPKPIEHPQRTARSFYTKFKMWYRLSWINKTFAWSFRVPWDVCTT